MNDQPLEETEKEPKEDNPPTEANEEAVKITLEQKFLEIDQKFDVMAKRNAQIIDAIQKIYSENVFSRQYEKRAEIVQLISEIGEKLNPADSARDEHDRSLLLLKHLSTRDGKYKYENPETILRRVNLAVSDARVSWGKIFPSLDIIHTKMQKVSEIMSAEGSKLEEQEQNEARENK